MKVTSIAAEQFLIEFENEAEFQTEYEANIAARGMYFQTPVPYPEFTALRLTLEMKSGGKFVVPATVVRVMGDALAVALDAEPELIREALTNAGEQSSSQPGESEINTWEKVRNLSRIEKLLLAPKASRPERQVLLQDQDAQVIYSLLKNPRITAEEVVRIARSPLLSAIAADTIVKTTLWAGNQEIRSALVHNGKTPTPLALRLLPTLPEPEIRQIAKSSAVSQALRQAALRIVVQR